ncbi:MAG: DUF4476 domain-containing protein [Ferruginibacter sp.]
MKISLQVLVMLLLSVGVSAQQKYFAYIQSEDKQPFSINVSDKVLTSSPTGYIVIPKLTNGTYALSIGFPGRTAAAQIIILTVANADAGYLLKNFGEKGWGLFNARTLELQMNAASGAPLQKPADADDVFINVLANAANTPVTATKVIPVETAKVITVPTPAVKPPLAVIERIDGTVSAEGRSYIYVERNGTVTDTIMIFIPAETIATERSPAEQPAPDKARVEKEKFLNIELQNPNAAPAVPPVMVVVPDAKPVYDTALIVQPIVGDKKDKPIVTFNSDCKAIADENDFLKIRKKMAAAGTEEGMMAAAKKFFRSQCWSTEQVKNLSLLFLTDAGKYQFFDAAYPRTHDTQNFATLQSQLKEEYFINRFRAMVRIN